MSICGYVLNLIPVSSGTYTRSFCVFRIHLYTGHCREMITPKTWGIKLKGLMKLSTWEKQNKEQFQLGQCMIFTVYNRNVQNS